MEPTAQWVDFLAWHMAVGYSLVGEVDRALAWLDRAVNLGLIHYPFLMTDPLLARIRGEPGFTQVAERVKRAWETFEV